MADMFNRGSMRERIGRYDNEARWTRWASWLGVIAGIWLIIAPFVLDYATTRATVNSIILGVVAILVSALGALTYSTIPNWVHVLAGIWLVVAPFALNYSGVNEVESAFRSDVAAGAFFIGLHFAVAMGKMAVDRLGAASAALEGRGVGPEEELMRRKAG